MFSALMANTWVAATVVAVVAGVVGFFVVLRGSTFVAHAVPHGAFGGAAGAVLLGINPVAGARDLRRRWGAGHRLVGPARPPRRGDGALPGAHARARGALPLLELGVLGSGLLAALRGGARGPLGRAAADRRPGGGLPRRGGGPPPPADAQLGGPGDRGGPRRPHPPDRDRLPAGGRPGRDDDGAGGRRAADVQPDDRPRGHGTITRRQPPHGAPALAGPGAVHRLVRDRDVLCDRPPPRLFRGHDGCHPLRLRPGIVGLATRPRHNSAIAGSTSLPMISNGVIRQTSATRPWATWKPRRWRSRRSSTTWPTRSPPAPTSKL